MTDEIQYIKNKILMPAGFTTGTEIPDPDCPDYSGYSIIAGNTKILFRKAKITPKKTGQFVTLWKRNLDSRLTEPYTVQDPYDFYLVFTGTKDHSGFFFFPREILAKKTILSTPASEGKRAFRVYPAWDIPGNPQGERTQNWQKEFFIRISDQDHPEKFNRIAEQYPARK